MGGRLTLLAKHPAPQTTPSAHCVREPRSHVHYLRFGSRECLPITVLNAKAVVPCPCIFSGPMSRVSPERHINRRLPHLFRHTPEFPSHFPTRHPSRIPACDPAEAFKTRLHSCSPSLEETIEDGGRDTAVKSSLTIHAHPTAYPTSYRDAEKSRKG